MKTATILFIYNRPQHTKQVLEGLKENKITKLYVFGDGPKSEEDILKVQETRQLVNSADWCDVEKEYQTKNSGLAASVIHGVTQIFNKGYDAVIVLEDDCVPNKYFLDYMLKNLVFYENDPEIMHITGFAFKMKNPHNSVLYVAPWPGSWGWGTWKRHWLNCNFFDYDEYLKLLNNPLQIKKFNYAGEAFSQFLQMQLKGRIDSWLIRWYFHIFKNQGKCLWPYKSYIHNVGFDGSGRHKVGYDRFNSDWMQKEKPFNSTSLDSREFEETNIRIMRRYFQGKCPLERIKSVVYFLTGVMIGK